MYICKFCNQERKNANSLRNHERLCKSNPNRQTTVFQDINFHKIYSQSCSNQYIKAARLGLPAPIVSEETSKKLSDAIRERDPALVKEIGKKASATINEKVKRGEWHTSLAKHMHIDYNGVDLHGSWELKYARYLDSLSINWIRNKDSFSYIFDGKSRRYTPDFYLPETDEYIEIKGYKTIKDEAKWSQFPSHRKLTVLMKTELMNLGIL